MRAAALLGLALGLLAGVGSVPASAATAGAPATAATSALPPSQPVTWNFTQAHVTGGQGAGRYGSGVTVAVIDTWVDASHPDFGGRVVQGADCRSGTCVPGSAPIDSCGHGTHVAGTIASETYGVAPLARILPVTVLGADATGACSGSTAAVAAGIAWATTHGAQVENLSIGEDSPALLQDAAVTAAISSAAAAGVVVTVAAGNANRPGQNADMYVPSYGDKALVVAATGPGGQVASYSNVSPTKVALAAPGGDPGTASCTEATCVASTWPGSQYALLSGTSMAAPHVSGAAALLLAADPALHRAGVVTALQRTAHARAGTTYGLLDVQAAVGSVPHAGGAPAVRGGASAPKVVIPAAVPNRIKVKVTAPTIRPAPGPAKTAAPPAPRRPAVAAPLPARSGADLAPRGPWLLALAMLLAVGWAAASSLRRLRMRMRAPR